MTLLFMVLVLFELVRYLITHPGEIMDQLSTNPILVIIMVFGWFILSISLIANTEFLFGGRKYNKLILRLYYLEIILLWILLLTMIIQYGTWDTLVLNIFFLPIYLQMLVMHYHSPSRSYYHYCVTKS